MNIRKGRIVLVNLKGEGHCQSGKRPCLIISNNYNIKVNSVVMVIPMTTKIKDYETRVLHKSSNGVVGQFMIEQATSIDKKAIVDYFEDVNSVVLDKVLNKLKEYCF